MTQVKTHSALLRLPTVEQMTGLKRSSIYAAMRDKTFPQSVRLSVRAVAWRESEVIEWIKSKAAATYKAIPPKQNPPQKNRPHTKHGWIAVGARVEHIDDNKPDICSCNPADFGQDGRSYAEMCANARLIAQAPRMLQAMREMLDCMKPREVSEEDADSMSFAAQVIAVATGGTQ